MKKIHPVFLLCFLFLQLAFAQDRPNILVIMFDDAGLDMSAYGSPYVNTPGFDAIAKEGVLFNRAYTPNAKCAPSRAAVMTGRNSWQLDAAANHIPMAVLWKGKMKKEERKVDDYVSFIDLAPTFLEAAGIDWQTSGMHPAAGKSLMNIITSENSGQIEKERDYVLIGKERHDTGRPGDVGYPIRGMHKNNMLYIKNYEIDRWPSGNPETGYLNTDGSPSKTEILDLRRNGDASYWKLNFGKRAAEELYDVAKDPFCMNNLASDPSFGLRKKDLKNEMEAKLLAQDDLRMLGYGHLYEQAPFVNGAHFYSDFTAGKNPKAGWVNDTDFESFILDGEGNELEKVETGLKKE